jgi:ribosomal protein S18 acetylase RimI-like enzyme
MKIREAKSEEAFIIAEFQQLMAFETENITLNPATVSFGVAAVFKNSSKGKYLVAEIDNSVVGSLLVTYEWSDWRNATVLWIQSVYVKPEFRKAGVFANLFQFVKKISEEDENIAGIRLYVDRTNEKACAVYEKVGMNGQHYLVFEEMKT